jgi:RND family efflux transporter MFP subunit
LGPPRRSQSTRDRATRAASCALLLLAACTREVTPAAPPPTPVTVAAVERRSLIEWAESPGRAEPTQTVEVRPRVSGYLSAVRFRAGQLVAADDVLFTIDPRWHEVELARCRAERDRARARLDTAQREAKRAAALRASGVASIRDAELRDSELREARAALLAAQAELDRAQLDLEYTTVRSPIAGRVSRALLTEGNFVSGMPGSATLLTTVLASDPMYVYADVDEASLLRLSALSGVRALAAGGEEEVPVELQLADEPGFSHSGRVESLDTRIDAGTGSLLLRALFANPEQRIVPGLFVRLRVPLTDEQPVLLVDERAIGTDQGRKFVLAVSDANVAEYRAVVLGGEAAGKRIVTEGLAEGDRVIVSGQQRVRPGMPVLSETADTDTARADAGSAAR